MGRGILERMERRTGREWGMTMEAFNHFLRGFILCTMLVILFVVASTMTYAADYALVP